MYVCIYRYIFTFEIVQKPSAVDQLLFCGLPSAIIIPSINIYMYIYIYIYILNLERYRED